ncbi:dicarboxylate/amino acid:cation symporter [Salipaludibacillus agaradhaerens]|jgi:Na+/H+-dicarboxylate symporter|uniref:Dicarboxylate/amino acid:cation symporter n=1 Tax=Salipaludibacillus agaradhaerens TaxID=76935 RepID=A0A9Q4B3F8_SALAG|nr:dicarboxylate/amino acid:cation symporter [Salipaludibacillus agaradhaerens]MCR6097255.1 dicarboxylate/amino acid:cation symporter [Salipaludibacillus agaradhaerens]MCR6105923.1 dicarboxylate/amino acid:cation symporter [Salipaludibacillus agaradhaerens]MCR6113260.1 dicarboxylate/amino acid:cation symporter [Salipaludibacillus agaradhaerens]MCR6117956.1 dicarboxylate/amino acid:cation symporter [Salipaludibacillus agaradhaerens]
MKINFLTQILIAFILAVILGAIVGPAIDIVSPLGEAFLRLIRFIIVPLILTTLITGVASSGNLKKIGRLGGKTVAYYLATSAIAITLGLGIGYLFQPGEGVQVPEDIDTTAAEVEQPDSVVDTFLNIIPTNPFQSLVEGNILQIIFFALFVGIAITAVGEKAQPVLRFFEGFSEIMFKITGYVILLAPIGVFGLIAPIVGEYGLSIILPLLKVIAAVAVACLIHVAVTYSLAVKALGKMSPITFFKGIAPASIFAFSSASSAGTLPITIKNVTENLGVSKGTSSFVLPLGATINMDGTAIYQGVAVLFIAQFYGIELTVMQLLSVVLIATLASIGTAGVPGAGLIMLTLVLTNINLPLEGIALVAGIDRILDMFRTSVNVMGDASAAVIIDRNEPLDEEASLQSS